MSSKMPSDHLVPRGLNGLIDTYPDMNYGLGTLEKTFMTDGTADFTSGLPDGVVRGEDEGLGDLGDFMREGNIADMSFIDIEGDAHIQSLPEYGEADSSLESAWGELQTPAIYAEHQKDLTAIPRAISQTEVGEDVLEEVAMKCARLLHTGASIKNLQKVAFDRLGSDVTELREDFEYLTEERGLMGNVYVLASAYPQIETGHWNKAIKKASPHAQYLLIDDGHALSSQETFNGMKVVLDVPYKQAFEVYKPLLEASGRKLASGDSRTVLKQAFLTTPQKRIQEVFHEKAYRVVDTVSMKEAQQQFGEYTPEEQRVYQDSERQDRIALKKAHKKLASAYRAGMMSRDELKKLAGMRSHTQIELELHRLKLKSHAASDAYSGAKNSIANQESLRQDQGDIAGRVKKAKEEKRVASVKAKVAVIKQAIDRGVRGDELARIIQQKLTKADLRIASPILNPILKETNALALPSVQTEEYSGASFTAHQEHRRTAHVEKLSQTEIAIGKMARWTRQQMTEGTIGKTLTAMLKTKFASPFLKKASTTIQEIRTSHEGLSGHLYVDAEAYASPVGTKGCDEGGLKHRANQLPFVMGMDRCGSCSFASRKADGTSVCQKYNKPIITELPVESKGYQAENIRMADASDAEITASIFASRYEPSEFNLANSELDNFSFEEMATAETLSNVFFGGMEIHDDE